MHTAALLFARCLILAGAAQAPAPQGPALVPLDDGLVLDGLLPTGVSRNTPELFGRYVHVWALPDGTQVLQYFGDFILHLGERRGRSRDAVVWMQKSVWNKTNFYHYEVFLSQEAEVRDSAGTVTTAPMLFVTFNSTNSAVVEADVHTSESSEATKLYQEGAKIRHEFLSHPIESQPGDMQVIDLGQSRAVVPPKARPLVRHRAKEEVIQEPLTDEGVGTITATGDVYISQGLSDSTEFLEIRADAAVLFLAKSESRSGQGVNTPVSATGPAQEVPFPRAAPEGARAAREDREGSGLTGGISGAVSGAYLRGDVVLTRGERMIRASELYYDFENDRALILDAVMRAIVPERNLPIYVRAKEVRQLSKTEYFIRKAAMSTSEFYTPHVHLGAERVYLTDATPRDEAGRITGVVAGAYRMHDTTLNIEGVPVAYWPYSAGDFRQAQSPVQNMRFGYSDDFGATFQSKWYLFNLLGMEQPKGVDALLRLDYFSKRGPGVGLDVDYETENNYGMLRSYYVHDTGEDKLGPIRSGDPDTDDRGRHTLRHRQLLGQGWELTLEASYISDVDFMDEYFRREFETGKEQETLLYLKKQQDNWAFTTLAQWRVMDFLTQTEHFPDTSFQWIGEPFGDFASYFNETHLGFERYRPDDRRIYDRGSHITFRGDTRNEIDIPIKVGSANIVPFATGRPGYWSSAPGEGGTDRLFGSAGVRTGTQLWRIFEQVQSRLLNVNGVRHVIRPEATAWASASNRDSNELWPFDEGVENINDFYGTSLALRQQWQTKRGGPGRWRTIDWITFDIELNLFGNTPKYGPFHSNFQDNGPTGDIGRFYDHRPEDSIARNHVRTDFKYRISDTTAILSEGNYDLDDGSLDLFDVSYAVERGPRFAYFLGYRRIGDTDSNLAGAGFNYELTSLYRVALRGYYDLERGELGELDLTIIRKFPRWYGALTFGLDKIENDDTPSVSLAVWPEGAPNIGIGSRRYAGVAESTGIRPED